MTTSLGFSLTNHAGAFIERAPDEFSQIRDIYLKYRAERAAQGKSHAMTIFDARDELHMRTGLDDVQLSLALQRLSTQLILANPKDYARGVSQAWVSYFAVPVSWKPESATGPKAAQMINFMGGFQRWIIRGAYVLFLCTSSVSIWVAWIRLKGRHEGWNTAALLSSAVLASSLMQALLEYGENGRYALPTQSVALAALITVVALTYHKEGAVRAKSR